MYGMAFRETVLSIIQHVSRNVFDQMASIGHEWSVEMNPIYRIIEVDDVYATMGNLVAHCP